ncbi:hypothetical protein DS031_17490 [Bacillus taeanensis]|uniref:Lipoyl-binding domain-containing protein n=1 Tax=Bacillus taeanensis TaxID=273032 RepID=A0A366XQE4_9BACI|nr:hypothetical protein DS031_17490 [Bacillus taeanensis]
MVLSLQKVISPCLGVVEKVNIDSNAYIYEWEALFLIKTVVGTYEEIRIPVSGHVTSLKVEPGDVVTPNMTLALVQDDFIVSGSD